MHWAVPVVLSYNDVPFEALAAAFAGFSLPMPDRAAFDAARVMQKFGLRGDARAQAPMVLNVPTGEVMWIDANLANEALRAPGRDARRAAGPAGGRPVGALRRRQPDHGARRRGVARGSARRSHRRRPPRPVGAHRGRWEIRRPRWRRSARRPRVAPDPVPANGVPGSSRRRRTRAVWRRSRAAMSPRRIQLALLVDGRAAAPWEPVTAVDLTAGLVAVAARP